MYLCQVVRILLVTTFVKRWSLEINVLMSNRVQAATLGQETPTVALARRQEKAVVIARSVKFELDKTKQLEPSMPIVATINQSTCLREVGKAPMWDLVHVPESRESMVGRACARFSEHNDQDTTPISDRAAKYNISTRNQDSHHPVRPNG